MSRRLRPVAGLLAAVAAVAAGQACADPRPPHFKPTAADELGIWQISDRAERAAKSSAELDADPALNAYVTKVACKISGDYCSDIRVYVLDRPYFNATMAPNGCTEVWSGLLLRVDDEAELAFVLGHETTHFVMNHSLAQWRRTKNATNTAMVFTAVVAGAGGGGLGGLAYLGAAASIYGYSREHESEADRHGFELATAAGYDPSAGAAIWRNLTDETDHSDFEKVRTEQARPSIFRTHPITAERIADLDALAKGKPAGGGLDRKAYRAVIRPHLAAWLADDLRRRDFGESLTLIDRLSAEGEDLGLLGFYKAEALRQRGKAEDATLVRDTYRTASAQADAPVAVWRELGDAERKLGHHAEAKAAYATYLAKATDADDRWLVEGSLKAVNEGGAP